MKKKAIHIWVKLLIVFILLADFSYSFFQHYNMPLDGDMADIIVPAEEFKEVLMDPFGFKVLTNGEKYANPNRFFFHWSTEKYFKAVPIILQAFVSPVQSVYLACALLKTLVQLLLVIILAWYTVNFKRLWSYSFLIPAFLIFSLFQTMGYVRFMGIIDPSVVYTFAYALPMIPMLIFYIPFYKFLRENTSFKLRVIWTVLLSVLAIFLSLNGPLVPAQMIIINGLIALYWLTSGSKGNEKNGRPKQGLLTRLMKMPGSLLYLLLLSSALSIYSLGLGFFNSLNAMSDVTLMDYYSRLPGGLYYIITTKLGWPVLMIFILVNIIIINRMKQESITKPMMLMFRWVLFLCFIYIAFLPLGGYRWYRPDALRYDTLIPVTLACIFIFSRSSYYILNELHARSKLVYAAFLIGFVAFFTLNDEPNFGATNCEIEQLKHIASSSENPVEISNDCKVLSWETITNPDDSRLQGELIYLWNISSEKKTYYQRNMYE